MPTPIEERPESDAGRRPEGGEHPRPPERPARAGASIRREEGDETEFAGEIRERERDEPPIERDVE